MSFREDRAAFPVFALTSIMAVALGAWVMAQAHLPAGLWLRNPVAWLVGGAMALGLMRWRTAGTWAVVAAIVLLAVGFLGAGSQDVHRWLSLGPVQINIAALVLPLVIVSVARKANTTGFAALAVIATLLALQPDRSQLGALMAAGIVLAFARFGYKGAFIALIVGAAAMALCLSRPDPLAPVAYVEGIAGMAWGQSPVLAVLMVAAVVLAALSPLLIWTKGRRDNTALALALYALVSLGACAFGAYPVPLAGYGLSYVIGWWLGIGALLAKASTPGPQ